MLRPSRWAAGLVLAAGLATLALLFALAVDPIVKALAVSWVGATWLHAFRTLGLAAGLGGVREFVLRAGAIEVRAGNGRWLEGSVRNGSFVAPWLTIIRWRPAGGRFDRSVVVLPDMLDAESFRRLRVLLRWG